MSENQNSNQINTKDFAIGMLLGGIIGGTLAFLTAPKTGKELRSDLNNSAITVKNKGGQVANRVKQNTSKFGNQINESYSKIKEATDINPRFDSIDTAEPPNDY